MDRLQETKNLPNVRPSSYGRILVTETRLHKLLFGWPLSPEKQIID